MPEEGLDIFGLQEELAGAKAQLADREAELEEARRGKEDAEVGSWGQQGAGQQRQAPACDPLRDHAVEHMEHMIMQWNTCMSHAPGQCKRR